MARFASLAAAAFVALCAAQDEGVVTTPLGPVQGIVGDSYRVFRGIPYATPPIGDLRWQSPLPAAPWAPQTWQALVDPPGCVQHCAEPPHDCPLTISEDCLYLNVWTPRASAIPASGVPVLIFIHGGNFRDGFGGGLLYDGSALVNNTGMVVVAINYRLGVLGFGYTAADNSSDPAALTGNYGLQDQRAAMRWVRDNIAGFGGDPARVTISGQSAGAMSVASHLIAPASQGLFAAAVMESEPFALPFRSPQSAQAFYAQLATFTRCNGTSGSIAACLRTLNSNELLTAQMALQSDINADLDQILHAFMPYTPVWDTPDVPVWPLLAFQGAAPGVSVADVPIVVGTTTQEGWMFIFEAFAKGNMSAVEYVAVLEVIFGLGPGTAALERYPVPSPAPADMRPQAAAIATTALFKCSTRNATRSLAALPGRRSPIFKYVYDHVMSWAPAVWGPGVQCCWDAVCHGADLISLWHPYDPQFGTDYTAAENVLSQQMEGYWGSFLWTGAPGNGVSPAGDGTNPQPLAWPAIGGTAGNGFPVLRFATPAVSILDDTDADECEFWDTQMGYAWY